MLRNLGVLTLFLATGSVVWAQCTISNGNSTYSQSDTTTETDDSTGNPFGFFTENPTAGVACGAWTATSDSSWITVSTPSGPGEGNSVQFSVAPNSGAPRLGTITVTWPNTSGGPSATYSVFQLGSTSLPAPGPYRVDLVYSQANCTSPSPSPSTCTPNGTESGPYSGPYYLTLNPGTYLLSITGGNMPLLNSPSTGLATWPFTPTWAVGAADGSTLVASGTIPFTYNPNNSPAYSGGSPITVTVPDGDILTLYTATPSTQVYDPNVWVNVTVSPAVSCTTPYGPVSTTQSYNVTCSTAGPGTAPWTRTTPGLPAGLTATPGTGASSNTITITGTPANATVGPYYFSVNAASSDSVPVEAQARFSGVIVPPSTALQVSCTPSEGPLTQNVPYTAQCTASGGTPPYSWNIASNFESPIPNGLTEAASGNNNQLYTISGTVTNFTGPYSYTITVSDSLATASIATFTYQGWVDYLPYGDPPAMGCSPSSSIGLSDAAGTFSVLREATVPWNMVCVGSGGAPPYSWGYDFSTTGLTALNLISNPDQSATYLGTEPAPVSSYSTSPAVFDDSGSEDYVALQGSVVAPPTLSCTNASGPAAYNQTYSNTCTASGGTPYFYTDSPSYIYWISAGALPAGLSLDPNTGTISGTVTGTGSYSFTVNVFDAAYGLASNPQTYSGTLTGGPPPTVTSISPLTTPAATTLNTLTINGTNFAPGSTVLISNDVTSTTLTPSSINSAGTQILVSVPASAIPTAGGYNVFVVSNGQTSANSVVLGATPVLSSIVSPPSAVAGGPAFTLTVSGLGFAGEATLFWNGTALSTSSVTPTSVQAQVAASLFTTPGTYTISATSGGYNSANTLSFTVYLAPTITSPLNPSSVTAGSPSFPLTITGSNLTPVTSVSFNGATLTPTSVSATQVVVQIPAADILTAGSVNVFVTAEGVNSNTLAFTINPATITLNPSSAVATGPAFLLSVNGSNFTASSQIEWNGAPLSTTFVSSSQLTTTVPASDIASAGTVTVSAVTGGVAPTAQFTVYPAPAITAPLNPSSVTAGAPSFPLTISGTNLAPVTSVSFNGATLTPTSVSATQVVVQIPAADILTAGSVNVFVTADNVNSNVLPFTINPATITLNPSSAVATGPSFPLTVNGSNFTTSSVIQWNGAPLPTTFVSSSQLTTTVPASDIAAAGTITVTAVTGSVAPTAQFTIYPAPAITAPLNPTSVTAGSPSFPLTISGTNLAQVTSVSFNGATLTPTSVSATQVVVQIPASDILTAGTVNVFVTAGAVNSNTLPFTINAATIVLNPSSAVATGPAVPLTVTGSNFTASSVIQWNGAPLPTTFVSSSQLTTTVPASDITAAGTATVSAVTGSVTASAKFTIYPAPAITAPLNPSSVTAGAPSFALTITGTNLTPVTSVLFNGATLTPTSVSATQVVVQIPASDILTPGSVNVLVTADGVNSNVLSFTINAASITLNPSSAVATGPAFTLTVSGSNFTASSVIQWNGTPLPTTFVSSSQLAATVPAADISAAGTATVSAVTGSVTASASFTINPAPAIASPLNPSSVTAGAPSFALTISGTNLAPVTSVSFNGITLSPTSVSTTQVVVQIPAADILTAGTVNVFVTAGGVNSNTLTFTINPAAITLNPSSAVAGGPAFTLTVNGTNFTASSVIQWNGAALPTTFVSSSQLTATVPVSDIAVAGTATVTAVTGSVAPTAQFTIYPAPAITPPLNPSSVTAGAPSFALTISGSNLTPVTSVSFNGATLTPTSVSATQVVVQIPATDILTAGTVNVFVTADGVTSNTLTFTINSAAITLNPSSAVAGGPAFTLTVNGTNFAASSVIQWNGAPLPTTFVSSSQLTANVPASDIATAGTVTVTAVTGSIAPTAKFTVSPPPSITAPLNPSSVTAGSTSFPLTITGSNLASVTSVSFNSITLVPTSVSATQVVVQIPASDVLTPGSVNVFVTAGGVPSNTLTFTINSAAIVLNPSSAVAGGPAFTLAVNGSGFNSGEFIQWNGLALKTTFVSSSELTASVPASDITTAGTVTVNVVGGISAPVIVGSAPFTIYPPPAITPPLNPSSVTAGAPSFALTISGSNLTSVTSVSFNGIALAPTSVSAAQVVVQIPASDVLTPGTANVFVTAGGVPSNTLTFAINPPTPVITSLSPSQEVAGGPAFTLTITGSSFGTSPTVSFGGTGVTVLTSSPTQITVTIPASLIANAGTPTVIVTASGSASNAQPFPIQPPSTISTISPTSVTVNGPAFTLTVNGANFLPGSSVAWNGTALTATKFVSSAQLTATVPASLITATGKVTITVISDGVPSTNSQQLQITEGPSVTSLNPNTAVAGGPAFSMQVIGTDLASATVAWNGVTLDSTVVDGVLTASVPASDIATAGTATVAVSQDGVLIGSLPFTIIQTPVLTSLSPDIAAPGASDFTMTVTGANFTASSQVLWNGATLPTTFVSSTELTAAVSSTLVASQGSATVVVQTAGIATSNSKTFLIQSLPAITNLNPPSAAVGAASVSLQVNGAGFQPQSIIQWDGASLTTTFVNGNQLTATLDASLLAAPGTHTVTVSTVFPGSDVPVISNSKSFTVAQATLTSISPPTVFANSGGFTLTANGSGFIPSSVVEWNGTPLATLSQTATVLTASVPASLVGGPASVTITVVTNGVPTSGQTLQIVSGPSLTALTPSSAVAGGAAFSLTVTGTGFVDGAVVNWNGSPLATTFSDGTLTAAVPASDIASQGSATITVTENGFTTPTGLTFTITPPVVSLVLTSISPSSVAAGSAAFTLTVNGSGFTASTTVLWNTQALATTFVGSGQLTAAVPASLVSASGSATITAVISGQAPSNGITFTITPPSPTISQLSPTTATVGTGFTLTVTGSGFTPSSTIDWNGTALPTTFTSGTQLTAQVPASLATGLGTASVTVVSSGTTSPPQSVRIAPVTTLTLQTTSNPTQANSVGVALGSAATVDLTGQLRLSFTSSVSGYSDQNLQFSCTGATCDSTHTILTFTVPAGQTSVSPLPGGSFSQETVAGTVTLTLISLSRADTGVSVLPATPVTATLPVAASAPVILPGTVSIANMTSSGFSILLNGFSTTRDVTAITFTFAAATGDKLNGTTSFTINNVASDFATWFNSSAGVSQGSLFGLTVPFTFSGNSKAIGGVTVTLTNSVGTSAPESATVSATTP